MSSVEQGYLQLPVQVAGRVDVGRLLREVEQLDEFLKQAAIREPGTSMKMPKTSRLLDEFLSSNKMNLLQDADRSRVLSFLVMVKAKAPVLHVSFGVDPSPIFIQKLMSWLRKEIHPLVLVHVGLQPNIGAGCVVRTTNKFFDFSLREHFKKQRELLASKLHTNAPKPQPAAVPAAPVEAAPVAPVAPTAATAPAIPTATAEAELAKQVEAAIAGLDEATKAAPSAAPAPVPAPAPVAPAQPTSPVPEAQKVEVRHA